MDKSNIGLSGIIGFGNYTGGETWAQHQGFLNVSNKLHRFDGQIPHFTTRFVGERYTAVFYTHKVSFDSNLCVRSYTAPVEY